MLAVGTDIVRVSRLDRHAGDDQGRFLQRVFTRREIDLSAGRPSSLAGRWAAKESVLKALGCGIGDVPLTDVEVVPGEDGRPGIHLHDRAAERARAAGLTEWHVSISHDGDYAVATVVASG